MRGAEKGYLLSPHVGSAEQNVPRCRLLLLAASLIRLLRRRGALPNASCGAQCTCCCGILTLGK